MTEEEKRKKLEAAQQSIAKSNQVVQNLNSQQSKIRSMPANQTAADTQSMDFSITPQEAQYLNTLSKMGKTGDAKAQQYLYDKFSPDKVLARQKAQASLDYSQASNPYKLQNLQYTTGINQQKYSSADINQQIKQRQAEINYLNSLAKADQNAANYDAQGNYIGTPAQRASAASYGQNIAPTPTKGNFVNGYNNFNNTPQATQQSSLSPEDQQALDWAMANPNDPDAQAILQMHGY